MHPAVQCAALSSSRRWPFTEVSPQSQHPIRKTASDRVEHSKSAQPRLRGKTKGVQGNPSGVFSSDREAPLKEFGQPVPARGSLVSSFVLRCCCVHPPELPKPHPGDAAVHFLADLCRMVRQRTMPKLSLSRPLYAVGPRSGVCLSVSDNKHHPGRCQLLSPTRRGLFSTSCRCPCHFRRNAALAPTLPSLNSTDPNQQAELHISCFARSVARLPTVLIRYCDGAEISKSSVSP